MTYILNLDYILEIKHIAKCSSSAAFPSDLNKKRNPDSVFLGVRGLCVCSKMHLMQNLEVTQFINKQLWKFSTVFSQPVQCLGQGEMSCVCLRLSCWRPVIRILVKDTWCNGQVRKGFSSVTWSQRSWLLLIACLKGLYYEEYYF